VVPHDRRGSQLSIYWFSQVISLRRGIGDLIRAAGLLRVPVQIHLRGQIDAEERAAVEQLAAEVGAAERVYLHGTVSPDALLARAAEHDVGFAGEPGLAHSLNNALTVSNKLFMYLLAGLAVAATDTPGQRSVLASCPQAGGIYQPGDHRALAALLEGWQADPSALANARGAALEAARTRWNWERERELFLGRVAQTFGAA
jgi:glycosyltransferase involved in cell wall biosynthesis